MSTPLLAVRLYILSLRPNLVPRLRPIERLKTEPHRKLPLASALDSFDETTLVKVVGSGAD